MHIPVWIISAIISLMVSAIFYAFGFGRLHQRVKTLEAQTPSIQNMAHNIDCLVVKVQALENDVKKIDELKDAINQINKTLYEMKGMFEGFMKATVFRKENE